MKKLLVTVIGAAAITASAAPLVMQDFETGFTLGDVVTTNDLNTVQEGLYWTDNDTNEVRTATNEYKIVETGDISARTLPAGFSRTQYNALQVKTTFGKPLSFNVNNLTNNESRGSFAGGSRLFFDSLVKFTVCEEDPTEEYDNAKIVMWLQEQTNSLNDVTGTNLMVKAGFLSYSGGGVTATPQVYNCGPVSDTFTATEWHRVTIKAVDDITAAGEGVPGFLIYIDGNNTPSSIEVNSDGAKKDSSFTFGLAEAVSKQGATESWNFIFPSMVQGGGKKLTIESASFDGTGTLETLSFTKDVPAFAADYVAPETPKANISVNGVEDGKTYGTLAAAVAAVNGYAAGGTAQAPKDIVMTLAEGVELDEPIEFAAADNATITLDFNGLIITNNIADCIITNNAELTVIDSVGGGGIFTAVEDGGAICQSDDNGRLVVSNGNFWANIVISEESKQNLKLEIVGGSFQQDADQFAYIDPEDPLEEAVLYCFAPNKFLFETETSGWYTVDDAYTLTFELDGGAGAADPIEHVRAGTIAGQVEDFPAAPTKAGYTFTGWTPSTNQAVNADIEFTATWEAAAATTFTITVDTLNANTTVSVTSNNVEVGTAAGAYVFAAGDEAGVTFTAADGYDFANNTSTNIAEVTEDVTIAAATVTAHAYSISYDLGLGTATNATDAVTSFTIEDASVTLLPAGCDGYTFNGWTNANGDVVADFVPAKLSPLANQTFYASWSAVTPTPTPIDPSADKVETVVTAGSESDAKANAVITPPAGSGADAAEYKALFDFSAVSNGDGTWTVTLTGIKDTVEEGVDVEAVKALTTSATSMQIPAGLYYRITPSTALPISGTSFGGTTPSTGSVSVEGHKPASTDKGFYKVELDYKPITD